MRSGISEPDRGELTRLLKEAGSIFDPVGVAALITGVLAAPAEVGASWHTLVADPMTPELARQLEALKTAMAAHYRDGLAPADFERVGRPERLGQLRKELAGRGLDGFIVPRADEHLSLIHI